MEEFVLHPNPPPATIQVPPVSASPATADALAVTATPATTAPNPDYATWKKRDRFVLLWLKSTLYDRALALVTLSTSSQMAWQAIERNFQAQSRASRFQFRAQLQTLSKGSMSMIDYIEKKRSIADFLATNLTPISNEELIGHILTGLDSSYGAFTTAFMMKTEAMTVDDLVGFLL